MKIIKALISENGAVSTVRVMALSSLAVGSVVALYGVYMGKDLSGIAEVSGVFVGAAFAGKVSQKYVEK